MPKIQINTKIEVVQYFPKFRFAEGINLNVKIARRHKLKKETLMYPHARIS
jgi:hypothetical protein